MSSSPRLHLTRSHSEKIDFLDLQPKYYTYKSQSICWQHLMCPRGLVQERILIVMIAHSTTVLSDEDMQFISIKDLAVGWPKSFKLPNAWWLVVMFQGVVPLIHSVQHVYGMPLPPLNVTASAHQLLYETLMCIIDITLTICAQVKVYTKQSN